MGEAIVIEAEGLQCSHLLERAAFDRGDLIVDRSGSSGFTSASRALASTLATIPYHSMPYLIVSEVKEPEALEAREHTAVEGGNLVVPEGKLVHFGGAGKRALLNRGDAVVAEPHQGEACRLSLENLEI